MRRTDLKRIQVSAPDHTHLECPAMRFAALSKNLAGSLRCVSLALGLALGMGASLGASESIEQVLMRSQGARLERLPGLTQGPAFEALSQIYAKARSGAARARPATLASPQLRVVAGGFAAECFHGKVLVVGEALAGLPAASQEFVLAHELGHASLNHWQALVRVYQKWIPGEVVKEKTDPIARELGAEASELSRAQELEADAFAADALRALGRSDEEIIGALKDLGAFAGPARSGTHPPLGARLERLERWVSSAPSAQKP